VAISPENQSGPPGATLSYSVMVKNRGAFDDNYALTISDNQNWGPTLDNYLFENVQPGENRTVTLSVTVPTNAVPCTRDNIIVTATSQGDPTVSDNDTCIAHAENVRREVEVSISPSYRSAPAGTTLSYTVTVRNKGNVRDNYALTVSDTENWGLSLFENRFENVAPRQIRTATLNVTIPGGAVPCTEDKIKVTATSLTDNTVENSAGCTAHAILREVGIIISPSQQRGGPDENIWGEYDLKYTVTITNRSAQPDNYTLTIHDNLGWDLRLVGSLLLGVPAGEKKSTTLYVKVPEPEVAKPGTEDFIVITATSQTDRRVSNYASCVAQAGVLAFEVSVSPSRQSGIYLYNILDENDFAYIVTVTNKGTLPDNYSLTVVDNLGWSMKLIHSLLSHVPAEENENTTLYVAVPFDAEPGTEDKITIVVTSQTDNTLSDNVSCVARAAHVNMEVTISPSYQRGSPGETIVYPLTVTNMGDGDKPTIYSLYANDNAGWELTIDAIDNKLVIPSGKSATTKIKARVPDNATHREMDNLTVLVSAPSQVYLTVNKKVSGLAQAETLTLFISLDLNSARPRENLTFTVWVTNVGIENDNYNITVSDDAGWGLSLRENSLNDVTPGESRQATLTVTIPENAELGARDNLMVTVIPRAGPASRESENCVAIASPLRGVEVSMSPKSQFGSGGAAISYVIIVKNIGTENDSYKIDVSDTQSWELSLSENLLIIPGLESRGSILEVVIPSEAGAGTVDDILITATSRADNTVSTGASCAVEVELPAAIVRGDNNAYNIDMEIDGDVPPDAWYGPTNKDKDGYVGNYPPLMAARRVGKGAVLAAGLADTNRNNVPGKPRWKPRGDPEEKLDVLLDKAFQWMKPGATKVLWYEGYEAYNTKVRCSDLVAALEAFGYTITGDSTEPITADLLAPYDILVIPQLELGDVPRWANGGNPDLLPDADVAAIKSFVEGGGGLYIVEATDFNGYNYFKVQNKILRGLGIYDISFQSDHVTDDDFASIYEIDFEVTPKDFGADYREATGLTHVYLYSVSTLIVEPERKERNVSPSISPNFLEGLPGETLTYTLTITNTGKLGDTYILGAVDNAGFSLNLTPPAMTLAAGASDNATLSVTIPEVTPRGIESRITGAVTSLGNPTLGDVAFSEAWTGALGVSTSIDPTSKSGALGENLKFYVYVTNTGDFEDNYSLRVSDTADWGPALSLDNLTIPKGRTKFAVLSVIIPENAASGAVDNIIVTVTSQIDNTVSAENSVKAYVAIAQGVDVSISPTDNSGAPGRRLNFDVTVRNTGTGADTFRLTTSDTRGWGPTLSVTSFQLPGGASRTGIQLSVEVPDDAAEGDSTTITVTGSGTGYQDSASCTARAIIRGVEISISPESQTGPPGENVTFTVVVANTGEAKDSYDLTVSDNAGWEAVLSERLLMVPAGENRTTKVSVIVPSEATEGESTTITVVATSRDDPAVSKTATCTSKARKKTLGLPIVPIGVGGAAIGGGIAAAVLLKSRPPKQSLLAPRPFRSNPGKARKYSEKWL